MNKLSFALLCSFVLSTTLPLAATAQIETSDKMRMLDFDQVKRKVEPRLKAARKIRQQTMVSKPGESRDEEQAGWQEVVDHIRQAMRIVYARPDVDGTRAYYSDIFRSELSDFDSFYKSLAVLAGEAVRNLKDGNTPVKIQATYLTILENILAEVRPNMKNSESARALVKSVADANIKISRDLQNERRLNAMDNPVSPSKTARAMMKDHDRWAREDKATLARREKELKAAEAEKAKRDAVTQKATDKAANTKLPTSNVKSGATSEPGATPDPTPASTKAAKKDAKSSGNKAGKAAAESKTSATSDLEAEIDLLNPTESGDKVE